jgi:hypothetical protein
LLFAILQLLAFCADSENHGATTNTAIGNHRVSGLKVRDSRHVTLMMSLRRLIGVLFPTQALSRTGSYSGSSSVPVKRR